MLETDEQSGDISAMAGNPPIDATDIVLDGDALGLGQPWESTNPALLADARMPGPDGKSPNLMGLLGNAMAPPSPELTGQFIGLKQKQLDAYGRQQANTDRRYEQDRQEVKRAFAAENAFINDTPKWDVANEREKYKTDPIESFGSFASVFAMVASAFTRAPMENALNGAAAAMNARRENNEFEYNRAFDAWKVNTDLAVKRFNMQHAALQDAFHLMDKDAARGNQKLVETMTKFGMEKELLLYQNGMIPEIQAVQQNQLKAIEGVIHTGNEIRRLDDQERRTKLTEQRDALRAEIERQKLAVASERDADKRAIEQQKLDALNERFLKSYELQERRVSDTERRTDLTETRDTERAETNKKRLEIAEKRAGKDSYLQTRPRQEAQEVARRTVELEEQGKPHGESYDQAVRESKARVRPGITANREEQLQAHIEQYGYALGGLDRVSKIIKEKGGVGITGKLARPGETVLNVLGGSNSTVYRQIEKEINELKLRTAKLLKDSPSSGRELSAVQGLVDSIVPGLTFGSSTQSVLDQFDHLKKEFNQIQAAAKERLRKGTGGDPSSSETPAPSPAESGDWWSTSPLKK